jgi:hypothetical protein
LFSGGRSCICRVVLYSVNLSDITYVSSYPTAFDCPWIILIS